MTTSHRSPLSAVLVSLSLLAIIGLTGCGGDDNQTTDDSGGIVAVQVDTIPPAATSDLRLRSPTSKSIALVWTSPGDDGTSGCATAYDIRFSKSPITEENWVQANPVDPNRVPVPRPCGEVETIVVVGLDSGTQYCFALKTTDDAGNESGLSNCATGMTKEETLPPASITDLAVATIDETSYKLDWTAPGDDWMSGTASHYSIRYASRPITDGTSWESATPVSDPPSPKPAGERQSITITGLTQTIYFFAIKTTDDSGNVSELSNPAPGLALGEVLWASTTAVSLGEHAVIVFRASDTDHTRVTIHDLFWWWEPIVCGEHLVKYLVFDTFPGGVHMTTFDFFDEDTNSYLPAKSYLLSVCHGPFMEKWVYLVFGG